MIDIALKFIMRELNSFLASRTGSKAVEAVLKGVVDDAGKCALPEPGIGISLVNLEEDRVLNHQTPEFAERNGRSVLADGKPLMVEPPVRLDLILLFTAHFKDYQQALEYLSHILAFFQSHPVFTPQTFPSLDARILRLSPQLMSPTFEQLNQIWAFIGGKQLPSVFYRARTVLIREDVPARIAPPITTIAIPMNPL